MSLILEALKKSEQQRKLGQAPTLGSPVIAGRRRRNLLPVLLAAIVVAAVAGWWLLRDQASPTPRTATDATKPPPAPATPVDRGAAAATAAKPPARVSSSNPSISVAQQGRLSRQAAAQKRPAPATQPAPADTHPAAPAAAPNAVPVKGATADSNKAVPRKGVNEDRPVTPITPPAKPVAAPTPAATTPVAAAKPAQPAVPSLFELPYAKRKDIPPIALSMHVYSSDPAGRFVVIKGDRHVEGDDLGDGLVIKQIRADGIVLDFKGTEFAFPRDGGH